MGVNGLGSKKHQVDAMGVKKCHLARVGMARMGRHEENLRSDMT